MNVQMNTTEKKPGKHDIRHMTRIVGYYSQIEEWNPSKHSELDDRHAGNYSIVNPTECGFTVPTLSGADNRLTAIEFGKTNCSLCDKAYGALERAREWAQKEYGQIFDIQRHHIDTEEGMVKALVSGMNFSRAPAVIFVRGRQQVGKLETEYVNGLVTRDSSIGTERIRKFLKGCFEAQ